MTLIPSQFIYNLKNILIKSEKKYCADIWKKNFLLIFLIGSLCFTFTYLFFKQSKNNLKYNMFVHLEKNPNLYEFLNREYNIKPTDDIIEVFKQNIYSTELNVNEIIINNLKEKFVLSEVAPLHNLFNNFKVNKNIVYKNFRDNFLNPDNLKEIFQKNKRINFKKSINKRAHITLIHFISEDKNFLINLIDELTTTSIEQTKYFYRNNIIAPYIVQLIDTTNELEEDQIKILAKISSNTLLNKYAYKHLTFIEAIKNFRNTLKNINPNLENLFPISKLRLPNSENFSRNYSNSIIDIRIQLYKDRLIIPVYAYSLISMFLSMIISFLIIIVFKKLKS